MRVCPRCKVSYPADVTFCLEDGARLEEQEESLLGITIDGRYLLEERIGAGGLGQVFRARHLRMEKSFAVKLLLPTVATDDGFIQRFDREAKALSLLTHLCCVAVTDYGVSGEYGPYIVMELVDGVPLSHYTRGDGLPLGETLELIGTTLKGLEHAHEQGIAHRDLKPDNIMLVDSPLEPGKRLPKILDFGLAKIQAGFGSAAVQITQAGLVMGTPSYMAPERITSGADVDDARADLYSLAVLLYELCCGRRPFVSDEVLEVLEMHKNAPPPPPRVLRPSLPQELEQLLLRALAKDPRDRFSSAAAFREQLEQLPELSPELAAEKPSAEGRSSTAAQTRVERPSRKRRLAAAVSSRLLLIGGGLGLALVAVIVAIVVALSGGDSTTPAAGGVDEPRAGAAVAGAARAPETGRSSLPPALRRATRLWRQPATRVRGARRLRSYLSRNPKDARAHLHVGRLYLYHQWASDGVKLVRKACRLDPSLRLDSSTLFALTLAYRGKTLWIARDLIRAHAGDRAPRVLLAAAAALRDKRVRTNLVNDARRRLKTAKQDDPLARRLLALAGARSCEARRAALAKIAGHDTAELRLMLGLLRNSRCLSIEARALLQAWRAAEK